MTMSLIFLGVDLYQIFICSISKSCTHTVYDPVVDDTPCNFFIRYVDIKTIIFQIDQMDSKTI
jgi:hypothetical protein